MSAPGRAEMPHAQQEAEQPLLPWHVSLRNEGAQHLDPARFHYLQMLSQRMDTAPDAVRRILQGKFEVALADYGERFRLVQKAASDELARLSARHPDLARKLHRLFAAGDYAGMRRLGAQAAFDKPSAPLAQLNQYLQDAKRDSIAHRPGRDPGGSLVSDTAARSEMASVRRFRQTWARMAAEDQVDKAAVRGPLNAGPLNSHMLVLRSLALMRTLSPDYLQRFLSHADTLLWLEQASQKSAPVKVKPARAGRPRK
ncbi:MAG: DUF2894 domain-containing protein [Lacisediminimonas sp.]|nr:DUF2894 domain-containing protein [Lacisediminimonas sp.]